MCATSHACVRHGERLRNAHVSIILITGSEHDETICGLVLITNVISEDSGESAPLCNLVRVAMLTNSKFLSGWRLRPKQSRHLRTPTNKLCFKYASINF